MFSAMYYITFAEGLTDADKGAVTDAIKAAATATGAKSLVATPHEGGSNCGNLICKLGFKDQKAFEAAKEEVGWKDLRSIVEDESKVALFEYGAYDAGETGITAPDAKNCVHRVLMFAEQERAKPEDIKRMNELCPHFADYVPILNWRVADVIESEGSRQWKHIWEQDFESYDVFVGIYMFTPFHPTYFDTFFDTECHNWVADPFLCTMTCDEEVAFITD